MKELRFSVTGVPVSQGSKNYHHAKGRSWATESAGDKLKAWRSDIRDAAEKALAAGDFTEFYRGPIAMTLAFTFERPKTHYRTGKFSDELRKEAPRHHISKPDADKLDRAVLDALSKLVYKDDSQVSFKTTSKSYGTIPGVEIRIWKHL